MTILELIQKINDSVLSDEAKKKIIEHAEQYSEVTPELEEKVRDLIQEDIDKDLAALEEGDDDPELASAFAEYQNELDGINNEMNAEMEIVDRDIKEITDMRAQVTQAEDAYKIARLREDLAAGS